jgi:hypothetical protein
MSKSRLITGVEVSQQMSIAKEILQNQVIPKEKLFQERKKLGKLSKSLLIALKANA